MLSRVESCRWWGQRGDWELNHMGLEGRPKNVGFYHKLSGKPHRGVTGLNCVFKDRSRGCTEKRLQGGMIGAGGRVRRCLQWCRWEMMAAHSRVVSAEVVRGGWILEILQSRANRIIWQIQCAQRKRGQGCFLFHLSSSKNGVVINSNGNFCRKSNWRGN